MTDGSRQDWLQAAAASVLAGWIRLCLKTMRWTEENRAAAERVWASGGGVVVCFWHSRIALSAACWPLDGRAQEPRALISRSRDGQFFAGVAGKLGFPAIRGSSGKATHKGVKEKGGAAAFRDVLRWIRDGGGVAITPDGPRGPVERMGEGPVLLARVSRVPVLLVGLAGRPAIRLGTWDKAVVPLPFAKGAIVWSDAFTVGEVDDAAAEAAAWGERLKALTRRAEALVA